MQYMVCLQTTSGMLMMMLNPACSMCCLCLLQVTEDVAEGHVVTGLSTRAAKNATELRSDFNSGRANRDTQVGLVPCMDSLAAPR